jgi:hypothetical protein
VITKAAVWRNILSIFSSKNNSHRLLVRVTSMELDLANIYLEQALFHSLECTSHICKLTNRPAFMMELPHHTFKCSNKVKISGRRGKGFTCSYTVKSLPGLITTNRLCFTKSNAELKPIVQEFKVVRQNLGVKKLKIFISDNLNGDGGLW